ncbi:MAG TPA: hypothetical protein VLF60_01605 [Candidatus Saccharimonadales bacterium]|nr:hypothetical protein [Candidatus Saccharimonadales bacterium]
MNEDLFNPYPAACGFIGINGEKRDAKLVKFDSIFELDCPQAVEELTNATVLCDFATLKPQEAVALYLQGGTASGTVWFVTRGSNQRLYLDVYDADRGQLLFENGLCRLLSACADTKEWGQVWEADRSRAKEGFGLRAKFVTERNGHVSHLETLLASPVRSCSSVVVVDDPAVWG